MTSARRPKPTEERALISNTSILILSGFLVGVTIGKLVAEDLSPYVLACGLSGFLAYIALDIAATRREEEAAAEDVRHVQGRLDRHVLSMNHPVSPLSAQLPHETTALPTLDSMLLELGKLEHAPSGVPDDRVRAI